MNNEELEVSIDGMHCVACAQVIEKAVKRVDGVESAVIDYALGQGTLQIQPNASKQQVLQAIKDAGYHAEIIDERRILTFSSVAPFYDDPHFQNFLISFLLTLPLLINMFGEMFHVEFLLSPYAEMFFATLVQFWCGRSLFKGAWSAIRALAGNMDLLVVLGSLASYLYSCYLLYHGEQHNLYFETGAFIVTVVLFGRWIEGGAKEKAKTAIRNLSNLRPKKVQVERMGELVEIHPNDLNVGELFFIKPGETVAADGVVIQGNSLVKEEIIFGELNPVSKQKGDKVYAGTINFEGLLKAKAEKIGSDTILEHVIVRAKKLHTTKAPIQRLADQIAEVFVPAIIATSLLVFLSWWFKTGNATAAFLPAIATLLIACPCAIGMATPIALLISSGLSAKNGILFHDARALELASKLGVFAFDKTGTLTEGEPSIHKVLTFGRFSENELLQILASIETFSTHPVARSIINYAKRKHLEVEPITHIKNHSGKGIEAQKRGEIFFAGSLAYAKENNIPIPDILKEDDESMGVVLIHNKQIIGAVLLKDTIRPFAKDVVENLKQRGMEVLLLSGDKWSSASSIGSKVSVDRVRAEILPDKKVDEIMLLKEGNKLVGMCGDGINDAFALAAADVGFSMASGSDLAIESSDITLMRKDLRGILDAIDLSEATVRKIKQNLFLACVYNVIAIPIAASGLLNPMVAAAAMVASSLSVVVNALFLRSWKPPSLNR